MYSLRAEISYSLALFVAYGYVSARDEHGIAHAESFYLDKTVVVYCLYHESALVHVGSQKERGAVGAVRCEFRLVVRVIRLSFGFGGVFCDERAASVFDYLVGVWLDFFLDYLRHLVFTPRRTEGER